MSKKVNRQSQPVQNDEPNITWEEFRNMSLAAQQIYGCLGVEAYWTGNLDRVIDREALYAEDFANDELRLFSRRQFDEGFDFLVKHGYLLSSGPSLYKIDKRCLYLVTDIMPYEEAKAGLIPGF